MADTNTTTLVGKLTNIADGFRSSRSLTETLSLDEMATLAAVPIGGENKLPQVIDKTVTELTAEDLAGATKMGNFAFSGCTQLTSIVIPDTVTSLGNNAFTSCVKLTSIIIPDSVLEMGNNMFQYCSALTTAVIGNGIQTLSSSAFNGCTNLTSVTIGNRVKNIGPSAFYKCNKLTSITIPNSVTTISNEAFQSCTKLTNLIIGNSVTSIGSYAFSGCNSLTSVTIPNSVTTISSKSLQIGLSSNKATITFLRTTPPSIASDTFANSTLNKIIVPKGCGEAYKTATNWAKFADFIEEAAE